MDDSALEETILELKEIPQIHLRAQFIRYQVIK